MAWHHFSNDFSITDIPNRFTFPFYYTPHPLAIQAAQQLQDYLKSQVDFEHNFGLNTTGGFGAIIGKMFGVLVVQNQEGDLGYIAAFSGKLANSNDHTYFVPPVFDSLRHDGFFLKESIVLNTYNEKIEKIENTTAYGASYDALNDTINQNALILDKVKAYCSEQKNIRAAIREKYKNLLSPEDFEPLNNYLTNQSLKDQFDLKKQIAINKKLLTDAQNNYNRFADELYALKEIRKEKSASLQQQLFEQYTFLNAKGESKSLYDIFVNAYGIQPPAAAGECAAPKLLQYAYAQNWKPIALAEFWWGKSPKSEMRQHTAFYPACKSKCEPILAHMLDGLNVEPNPLLLQKEVEELPVVYEDEVIVVINKPADFLSVPGIHLEDSVFTRMKKKYPDATGPLIVHRLDMATSGLLLIAKNKEVHGQLQQYFIKRKIHKTYEALLSGEMAIKKGTVNLPLRVDLDDRPRQLVCYEHGKSAVTDYEVVEVGDGITRILFYPLTGRTHQLRVHAAHTLGLQNAIKGDDLYGSKSDRLYLHAKSLSFIHPITKKVMYIEAPTPF